jgi:hypothetical protein
VPEILRSSDGTTYQVIRGKAVAPSRFSAQPWTRFQGARERLRKRQPWFSRFLQFWFG